MVEELMIEKRLALDPSSEVHLIHSQLDEAYGAYALGNPDSIRRAIGNLLQNAIEASPKNGTISVSCPPSSEEIEITIEDEGAGFPKEVLARLGEAGNTFGKADGNGIGLATSIATIQAAGGTLLIKEREKLRRGTLVQVRLPRVPAPTWFAQEVQLSRGGLVLIVDDDNSIHELWDKRLANLRKSGLTIAHARSLTEATSILDAKSFDSEKACTFLVDYEFQGDSERGSDWLARQSSKIQRHMVTSYSEDAGVQDFCAKAAITIIPKFSAGAIPLKLKSN